MKTEPTHPLTISLSPEQLAKLGEAVESGAYASNSEIIQDALRLWEQREELRQLELTHLKNAYKEGLSSGEPVDGETAFARIRANVFGNQSV